MYNCMKKSIIFLILIIFLCFYAGIAYSEGGSYGVYIDKENHFE
jgi:hypothetical protein